MTTLVKQYNIGISDKLSEQIIAMILERLDPNKVLIYGTGILNEILNEDLPTLL